jgi:hypothetical protein
MYTFLPAIFSAFNYGADERVNGRSMSINDTGMLGIADESLYVSDQGWFTISQINQTILKGQYFDVAQNDTPYEFTARELYELAGIEETYDYIDSLVTNDQRFMIANNRMIVEEKFNAKQQSILVHIRNQTPRMMYNTTIGATKAQSTHGNTSGLLNAILNGFLGQLAPAVGVAETSSSTPTYDVARVVGQMLAQSLTNTAVNCLAGDICSNETKPSGRSTRTSKRGGTPNLFGP